MLKKILIAVAAVIVLLVVVIAMQPAEFSISRSAVLKAPPAVAFEQVNDFAKWEAWLPWAKMDPAMKVTLGEKTAGVGATYEWVGPESGHGKMEILESKPGELVKLRLEFLEPMAAVNTTFFTFARAGEDTKVTWAMEGKNGFVSKAFGLFFDMEKMVGADFEKGLADLGKVSVAAHEEALAKAKAEEEARAAAEAAAAAEALAAEEGGEAEAVP